MPRPPLLPTPCLLPTPSFRLNVQPFRKAQPSWHNATSAARFQGGFSRDKNSTFKPTTLKDYLYPIARAQFQLIKCHHHLSLLGRNTPNSLKKTATSLKTVLHPAFCNDDFRKSANSIADTWLNSSIEILRCHYESVTSQSESFLRSNPVSQEDSSLCTSTAVHWAKGQLGRKLTDSELDTVLTLIKSFPIASPTSVAASITQCPTEADSPSRSPARVVPTTEVSTQTEVPSSGSGTEGESEHVMASPPEPAASNENQTALGHQSRSATTDTSRRKRRRTASGSPSVSNRSSQLDLFDTTTPQPRPRAHSLSDPFTGRSFKDNVVLADDNFAGYFPVRATVLARRNGRLSHYKTLLNSTSSTFRSVKKVIFCLSLLDSNNTFSTNSTTLKSVLGSAHRVFPKAQLFVLLLGISEQCSSTTKSNIEALNSFVVNKHPSSCLHIPAFPKFETNGHLWSRTTRNETFRKVSEYLN